MGSTQDPFAAFYGGYERTALVRGPRYRLRPAPVAIAIAALALASVIAADAAAIASGPPMVIVTSVSWWAGGAVLATTAGFHAHTSQTFTLTLTCSSVCYRFTGATVSSPFQVVSFTTIDSPIQFTNVTVRSPSSAYSGGLTVSLGLPPS